MLDVVAGTVYSGSLDCFNGNFLSGCGEGAVGSGEPSVVDYSAFVDLGLGHKVFLCLRHRQVPCAFGTGKCLWQASVLASAIPNRNSLVREKVADDLGWRGAQRRSIVARRRALNIQNHDKP
jgi:hypothetical protein